MNLSAQFGQKRAAQRKMNKAIKALKRHNKKVGYRAMKRRVARLEKADKNVDKHARNLRIALGIPLVFWE